MVPARPTCPGSRRWQPMVSAVCCAARARPASGRPRGTDVLRTTAASRTWGSTRPDDTERIAGLYSRLSDRTICLRRSGAYSRDTRGDPGRHAGPRHRRRACPPAAGAVVEAALGAAGGGRDLDLAETAGPPRRLTGVSVWRAAGPCGVLATERCEPATRRPSTSARPHRPAVRIGGDTVGADLRPSRPARTRGAPGGVPGRRRVHGHST